MKFDSANQITTSYQGVRTNTSGLSHNYAAEAAMAGQLISSLGTSSSSYGALGSATGIANAVGAFGREQVPWRDIANWTHKFPQSPTGAWMDSFKGGPYHRWMNHHPADFLNEYLFGQTPGLKIADFAKHLSLDVITTNGVPMLPQGVHAGLVKLGIPSNSVLGAWTHMNIFDVSVGTISLADGGYTLFLALTGHLPWEGMKTLLLTGGIGAVEIAGGIYSANPALVAGGVMHCAAGAISAWDHWHIPEPGLLEQMLPTLLPCMTAGAAATAIRLALGWRQSTPIERLTIGVEGGALSLSASLLGSIAGWLALPVSVAYGFGKLAWQQAALDSDLLGHNVATSPFTFEQALDSMRKNGGEAAVLEMKEFLDRYADIKESFLPESMLRAWEDHDIGEHVLAKQANWTTISPELNHILTPSPIHER